MAAPTPTPPTAPQTRRGLFSPTNIIILVVVLFLIVVGVFVLTGADPLNLFADPPPPTPTAVVAPTSGEWWDVYFTNPSIINNPNDLTNSIPEKLIARIDSARRTIDIAAFEFDLTPVAEALIRAHERGVKIRWVTDDEHGLGADDDFGHGQFAMLQEAGIEIKDDGRTALMHNKFIIFDQETVWTGSTNLTKNDNFRNNNNVIVIRSPEVAQIYALEFEEMWVGWFGPRSPSTTASQAVTINGTPIFILFASEDHVIDALIPIVRSAQKSIRFMAFSFTHDPLAQAMIERANRGVEVKGIFETRASETEFSELNILFCAGVPVKQDTNPGTFHHKVIIIDEKIVITGSLNFSDNADNSNDENTLVITNDAIGRAYTEEFWKRWEESREPPRAACP